MFSTVLNIYRPELSFEVQVIVLKQLLVRDKLHVVFPNGRTLNKIPFYTEKSNPYSDEQFFD